MDFRAALTKSSALGPFTGYTTRAITSEGLDGQRFYVTGQSGTGDRLVFASRTRFVTNRMLDQFDRKVWPEAAVRPTDGRDAGQARHGSCRAHARNGAAMGLRGMM